MIQSFQDFSLSKQFRIRLCCLVLVGLVACSSTLRAEEILYPQIDKNRPNILLVLCDDLGYGDLACYGHPLIKTPNIDHFAKEGLRLTDCYSAAANCSPSRTGLMTGRTPHRVGIHNWIPHNSVMHVRKREITVATLLRQSGYATCHVGKWHLNGLFNQVGQPQPPDHGFDHWFSTQNNALPTHKNPINFVRNGQPVGKIEGFSAHIVTHEAIDWLTNQRDMEKPFFMYVCYHEPHEPINSAKRFQDLYPGLAHPAQANHHGDISQMDDAFGLLLKALDDLKLRDNTFVYFTSDNGPAITSRHPYGSAGPLRDKKGSNYEGGIRVPGILRWPGHTQPGTVCKTAVSGVDVLPTLCELAKVPVPKDRKLDGASFLPILKDKPIQRSTPLYWQFNAARSKPKVAMRDGEWKILADLTGDQIKPYSDIRSEDQKNMKQAELKTFELYHMTEDISETTERSESEPARLKMMTAKFRKLYHDVREESPVWPAWVSPHIEGKIIKKYYQEQKAKEKAK